MNARGGASIRIQSDVGNSLGRTDLLTFDPRKILAAPSSYSLWWHQATLDGLRGLVQPKQFHYSNFPWPTSILHRQMVMDWYKDVDFADNGLETPTKKDLPPTNQTRWILT